MFNKTSYWKNRKAGKRGQKTLSPSTKLLKEGGYFGFTRRDRRKRGHTPNPAGQSLTKKYPLHKVTHKDGRRPIVLPFAPNLTNHQRHVMRRLEREDKANGKVRV